MRSVSIYTQRHRVRALCTHQDQCGQLIFQREMSQRSTGFVARLLFFSCVLEAYELGDVSPRVCWVCSRQAGSGDASRECQVCLMPGSLVVGEGAEAEGRRAGAFCRPREGSACKFMRKTRTGAFVVHAPKRAANCSGGGSDVGIVDDGGEHASGALLSVGNPDICARKRRQRRGERRGRTQRGRG